MLVQGSLKELMTEGCLAPLTTLARRFSYNQSAWNRFKKTQLQTLNQEEESNDNERDVDYDRDEDFDAGGEGQPCLKKVLRLLRPVATRGVLRPKIPRIGKAKNVYLSNTLIRSWAKKVLL